MPSAPLSIDITLPSEETVLEAIADRFFAEYGVVRDLKDSAAALVKEGVAKVVDEYALANIRAVMAEPLQPTDCYGKPIGEPVSLAAYIRETITQHLAEQVDNQGRSKGSTSFGETKSRKDWLLKAAVSKELDAAIVLELKKVQADLKTHAEQHMATLIVQRVTDLFKAK